MNRPDAMLLEFSHLSVRVNLRTRLHNFTECAGVQPRRSEVVLARFPRFGERTKARLQLPEPDRPEPLDAVECDPVLEIVHN